MAGVVYLACLAVLACYGAHRLVLIAIAHRHRAPMEPVALPDRLPVVTVQLPLYNERCVAERAIEAAGALRWPRDLLEIQVLDDSTDDTTDLCAAAVARLRARGIDAHHLRRGSRHGYKAGALAHGLQRARGELVLVLDADFVPAPDLLERAAGHFADPRVGMVQVRWEHLNRERSALTRVQALLLDGHFAVEQLARARSGRFFNFNGTAGLWRRAAIEDAGGWHHDTLTEDLDLSYRALLAGWRFAYLLDDAAPAELPADMNAFKSQQFRWAKGGLQVARKLLPRVLRAPLPWRVKLEAVMHCTQNVPYLVALALALALPPAAVLAPTPLPWLDAALALGATGSLAAYCAWSQWRIRRAHPLWTAARVPQVLAVTSGIAVSQTHAVLSGLFGRPSEFVRTPKQGAHVTAGYRAPVTLATVAELALAAYFALALAAAVHGGRYWAAPACALFAGGFAYVAARSIADTKK